MSIEAVISFWHKVGIDANLGKQIGSDSGTRGSEIFGRLGSLAKANGFDATADEFRAAETVRQFWKRVDQDAAMQREIAATESLPRDERPARLHEVAKTRGFDVSQDQLLAVSRALAESAPRDGELDDRQLEAVAGGAGTTSPTFFKNCCSGVHYPSVVLHLS